MQLQQRFHLISFLRLIKNQPNGMAEEYRAAFSRWVQYTRGVAVEKGGIPNSLGFEAVYLSLTPSQSGVSPVTFRHLYEHASKVPGYEGKPEKWFADMCLQISENNIGNGTSDTPLFLKNGGVGIGSEHFLLRVDNALPPKLLEERVIAQISMMRAVLPPSTKKRRHRVFPFQDWARNGLLPYLDLMIWEMETGISIPDRIMALAIRPSHDIGEGNLRKTLIPLAKRLMAEGGLDGLKELAATCVTAYKPKNVEN